MQVLKYLSFLLMVVALVGFYRSSSLHSNIVRSPNESASENWWLNNGFFVVWIPAMFALYQLSKNINERIINERDPWKVILGSNLLWMRFIILGLVAYGFIQYLFCWLTLFSVGGDSTLFTYWRIRGSSGAVIPFYFIGAVVFYRFWRS